MDELFFHPKVIHLPMALAILMPLVAGGLALAWWRKLFPARTWVVAVVLQCVLLASGVASLRTGEDEEDRVEKVVAEQLIEAHEEAAEAFVWGSGIVFALMLLGLAASGRKSGLPLAAAATFGTLIVFGLGYRTGQAGGALVYKHGAANAYLTNPAQAQPLVHNDDDDDDDDD